MRQNLKKSLRLKKIKVKLNFNFKKPSFAEGFFFNLPLTFSKLD